MERTLNADGRCRTTARRDWARVRMRSVALRLQMLGAAHSCLGRQVPLEPSGPAPIAAFRSSGLLRQRHPDDQGERKYENHRVDGPAKSLNRVGAGGRLRSE